MGKIIASLIAAVLFMGAGRALYSDTHEVCTQKVRSHDGTECVGDYVIRSGPDRGMALMLGAGGAIALLIGFAKPEPKPLNYKDYMNAKDARAYIDSKT